VKRLLLIAFTVSLITSCKKEATIWQTDWSAPLINDTLSLADWLNDSTLADNGGYYELDLERTLYDIDINDLVEIEDTTIEEVFTISVLNLQLSPGFSFVNSTEEHTMDVQGAELKQISLRNGSIEVTVKNPIPTNAFFDVTLPGTTKDGVTFNQTYMAPPGTTNNPGIFTTSIDLTGYLIDLSGLLGSEHNKFRSQISVSTDPNGPTVNITNQDETIVEATFKDIEIAYAQGYFGNQLVNEVDTFDLDVLNIYESGAIDLPNTSITFEIENGIKVGGQSELFYVNNTNSQGSTVSLTGGQIGSSFNVDPAQGWWSNLTPSVKTITFDSGNSNIEAFLENLGYKNEIAYMIELNPWGNVSGGWDENFPQSRIRAKLNVNMPLNIGMHDLVLRDTFEIDLNQDPLKTRVLSGEIVLDAENAFPYNAAIDLMLVNSNGVVVHTISGSELLESSEYGALNANNLMVASSEIKFVLSEEAIADVNVIDRIIVQAHFNSPNPANSGISEQMPIPVGAFLGVKLKTNFVTENVIK
jgi:hypothetical protein